MNLQLLEVAHRARTERLERGVIKTTPWAHMIPALVASLRGKNDDEAAEVIDSFVESNVVVAVAKTIEMVATAMDSEDEDSD